MEELGKNRFGEMAFSYEYLTKKSKNEYTIERPTFEFAEWFNQTNQKFNDVN